MEGFEPLHYILYHLWHLTRKNKLCPSEIEIPIPKGLPSAGIKNRLKSKAHSVHLCFYFIL